MSTLGWDWKDTRILPVVYQSGGISFAEWISLFTLGLAPLIAHIVVGTPRPSYLCEHQPKWHDRICHYNPTSILWRYAIITDRRIRARCWDPVDMVATNALFWTTHGWDGSEKMIRESIPQCCYLPRRSRIRLFSQEMLKTIIVTLQGVQAVVLVLEGMTGSADDNGFVPNIAIDKIFFPLAVLGLLRLCAGLWLTDEFLYTTRNTMAEHDSASSIVDPSQSSLPRISVDSLLEHSGDLSVPQLTRFRPVTYWGSILFRVTFISPIIGFLALLVLYMLPWEGPLTYVATSFLMAVFYFVFFAATLLICTWYFVRGATSTVIPCIGALWYKIYTMTFAALAVVLIIVSALETRLTPCGKYTSMSGWQGDAAACWAPTKQLVPMEEWNSFGIAATYPQQDSNNKTLLDDGEFWVYNFTGACIGTVDDGDIVQHAATLGVENITDLTRS